MYNVVLLDKTISKLNERVELEIRACFLQNDDQHGMLTLQSESDAR